ncbi:ferritin-like domain-containing protein [bacterium]|nr:ferritin-like domain-containing protein [bacterium]
MTTSTQFVEQLQKDNEALFTASKMNVKAYFESKDNSPEALVEHFIGRMVNERMNMVEISRQVANMPADADPIELQNLSKQAMDEAIHFRMVKECIEKITGEELDVAKAIADEAAKPTAKGADLLDAYEASNDEAALAVYQIVAEGRAAAVWSQMAETIEDEFIAKSYAKIAKDEGFHSTIGAMKLEKIATDAGTQAHVLEIVDGMRKDLFEVSCKNTMEANGSRELVNEAYGW